MDDMKEIENAFAYADNEKVVWTNMMSI
jgi:hypothetical protein